MSEKIVLIGAGSAMFTRGMVADLIASNIRCTLALVDIDPDALAIAQQLAKKMISARKATITLEAFQDRRKALPGATVVITTIGVGGRRAWELDVFIPRKYGLFYPVGDSVGPGGTSRALRMIPPMIAIARDILELAPDALFFNYANPMAPICRAVRKTTGANVVGLCTGTWDTALYLAKALNADFTDLSYTVAGINHLTWFTGVWLHGVDVMPRLHQIAAQRLARVAEALENAKTGKAPIPHCNSPFESSYDFPFSWQCVQWFDAFPAPQDRHITEFFPQLFRTGAYYGKQLSVNEFSFEGTIADGDRIYAEMRTDAFSSQALTESYFQKLGGEHEQAVGIIQAIRSNSTRSYFANLPNTGQVPNLPLDAVVETSAITTGTGIDAIVQPALSSALLGTLSTRYQWVETVVEAAIEASRAKLIDALILDGGVQSPDQAVALADEFLDAHKKYLPTYK